MIFPPSRTPVLLLQLVVEAPADDGDHVVDVARRVGDVQHAARVWCVALGVVFVCVCLELAAASGAILGVEMACSVHGYILQWAAHSVLCIGLREQNLVSSTSFTRGFY